MNATTLRMQYWLRDRPAETIRAPSYYSSYRHTSTDQSRCALGDDQVALPGWCADQQALIDLTVLRIQGAWTEFGCTVTGTTVRSDYDPSRLESPPTTYGNVNYGAVQYDQSAAGPGAAASPVAAAESEPATRRAKWADDRAEDDVNALKAGALRHSISRVDADTM